MDDLAVNDELGNLVRGCAAGDRAAFRTVYERQAAHLYGMALRLTREPTVASDVVHDTFLQLWHNAARFDPARGSAETWLATMLRYRAIDALRRLVPDDRDTALPEPPDEAPDALALLVRSDDARALRACLDGLDGKQRRAVTMAFLDGLSHGELAAALHTPLGTIKSTVRRGLLALRRCLQGGVAA